MLNQSQEPENKHNKRMHHRYQKNKYAHYFILLDSLIHGVTSKFKLWGNMMVNYTIFNSRMDELVEHGMIKPIPVISNTTTPETKPRHTYEITDKGRELHRILLKINNEMIPLGLDEYFN